MEFPITNVLPSQGRKKTILTATIKMETDAAPNDALKQAIEKLRAHPSMINGHIDGFTFNMLSVTDFKEVEK